jgi:hypothetical protein
MGPVELKGVLRRHAPVRGPRHVLVVRCS